MNFNPLAHYLSKHPVARRKPTLFDWLVMCMVAAAFAIPVLFALARLVRGWL